jgi:hypothetical protein
MSDDGIAKGINAAMFTLLLLAVCGLGAWIFVTEFVRVREIYDGLSEEQQRHVSRFLSSASFLLLGMLWLLQALAGFIKRDRPRETP